MKHQKPSQPTLAETIAAMADSEPSFSNVDKEAVRRDNTDYYENDGWRLGQLMVSRGTITADQLQLALARQAELSGDLERTCSHLDKLKSDMHSRAMTLLGELAAIVATLAGRAS